MENSIDSLISIPCYSTDLRQEYGEYDADSKQYHVKRKYMTEAGINGIKESIQNLSSQDVSE